jgi:hypothetical protein
MLDLMDLVLLALAAVLILALIAVGLPLLYQLCLVLVRSLGSQVEALPPQLEPLTVAEIVAAVRAQLEETELQSAYLVDAGLEIRVQRSGPCRWHLTVAGRHTPHESLTDLLSVLAVRVAMAREGALLVAGGAR